MLLGGEPFRLLRLSPAGAAILDDLCGADLSGGKSSGTRSEGPAATALAARLATGGLLHPLPVTGGIVVVLGRTGRFCAMRLSSTLR